jgi:anaerobic sulfite reductase subunit C
LKTNTDELKSNGFIKQTQENLYTVRLRCPGGKLTSEKLRIAADLAEKYGQGEVHTSFRQSLEIPYVQLNDLETIAATLKERGWSVASCGPRVRVPTACAGCTWNPNGLMDTQKMCQEVDKLQFGTATGHHKFKISFSGCPIDCARTREMDLGFQGIVEPELKKDVCTGCGLCATLCEEKALTLVSGMPVRDSSKCNNCGDCIKVCPVAAMVGIRKGWLVRVGGKHGKHPLQAYEIAQFMPDEQCIPLIEKTKAWYQSHADGRERIGATIERCGLTEFLNTVVKPLGLEAITGNEERRKFKGGGNLYL